MHVHSTGSLGSRPISTPSWNLADWSEATFLSIFFGEPRLSKSLFLFHWWFQDLRQSHMISCSCQLVRPPFFTDFGSETIGGDRYN